MRTTAALFARALRNRAYRKLPLTTKDINKGFYKGNRTGRMGSHTRYGGYIIEWERVRTYAVPGELKECKLTPFVSQKVETVRGDYRDYISTGGARSPQMYLDRWKAENGVD